jgi:DnaJ-class molecular chaperone
MHHYSLLLVVFSFLCCIVVISSSSDQFRRNSRGSFSSNRKKTEDKDYYDVLEVPKTSSLRDIKASYRKKAMAMHPDKGGDAEAFKTLVEAYEVLSDEKKRKLYDRFGKAGVQAGFTEPENEQFQDIFRGFGGFGSFGFQLPIVYNLELSLEDFYNGRELVINVNKEQLSVKIVPGMMEGMELRAELQSSQRQVIFILQQRRHPLLSRRKNDLFMNLKISLIEALLGFERRIAQLDGSEIILQSPRNKCLKAGDILSVEAAGMPIYHPNTQSPVSYLQPKQRRGDLYVTIEVEMPVTRIFSLEEKQLLQQLLGSPQRLTASTTSSTSPSSLSSTATSSSPFSSFTTSSSSNTLKENVKQSKLVDVKKLHQHNFDDDDDDMHDFTSQFQSFFFK